MSTAQRRGWKQSKLASWQQLNTLTQPVVEETSKTEPAVEPLKDVVEVEIPKDIESNVVLEQSEKVELPKIVKKNKKTD